MSNRIPVALCITELNIGGAERAITELAIRLEKKEFLPIVCSVMPLPKDGQPSCVPILKSHNIDVYSLEITGTFSLFRGFLKLVKLLKDEKIQVLQTFMFHANILGRIAAYIAGVPNVFSGIRVSEKDSKIRRMLDRATNKLVNKHVCVSESVAEYSQRVTGLPAGKIVVIPNGIEPLEYPQKTEKKGGKFAVVIGRLHRQKGIDTLIEMWPDKCRLLIIGEGEDEKLLKKAAETKKSIEFLGWRSDIPEILAESDLLILPSRWEGMPNVVLQAMAAGLPVLATRSEGVEELLGANMIEQTWQFGNAIEFREKFDTLFYDEVLLKEFGRRNRERVEQEYHIDLAVARYQSLWKRKI